MQKLYMKVEREIFPLCKGPQVFKRKYGIISTHNLYVGIIGEFQMARLHYFE